ncbi:hypothetical protein CTI14_21570 [Methylobacterium radiotolerans]|nr:hypothetical protein CTI14_21570 [Methylobacterium radiotolerans]
MIFFSGAVKLAGVGGCVMLFLQGQAGVPEGVHRTQEAREGLRVQVLQSQAGVRLDVGHRGVQGAHAGADDGVGVARFREGCGCRLQRAEHLAAHVALPAVGVVAVQEQQQGGGGQQQAQRDQQREQRSQGGGEEVKGGLNHGSLRVGERNRARVSCVRHLSTYRIRVGPDIRLRYEKREVVRKADISRPASVSTLLGKPVDFLNHRR